MLVHPHQHPAARPFRDPRADPAGAGGDAQCRHRAGGAAAGFGRRVRRPGAAVAPGDRAARRRRGVLRRRAHAGRGGAAARRPAAGHAVVQGRPGAEQRHRADAGHRRAGAAEARRPARHRRPRRGDDHRCVRRPPGRVRRGSAALRPHPGQVRSRREPAQAAGRLDPGRHSLPPGAEVPAMAAARAGTTEASQRAALRHRLGLGAAVDQRHGREKFYQRFRPFRGGKKHQPQDSYSLRCIPQVHGAVRDAVAQAKRVLDIELNSVTDNPLVFPDKRGRARRGAGDFRRPFPRHAAGAGDELRQGRDPGAGVDLRAPPQQAGRSRPPTTACRRS